MEEDANLNYFTRCTEWQMEQTTDTINCPYHYRCIKSSNHALQPSYPVIIDWVVVALMAASCILLWATVVFEKKRMRLWIPSGPLILPLTLLAMAKGNRINTVLPFPLVAPAWLQLLHISALSLDSSTTDSPNDVIVELSMVSGLLHASLYVDSMSIPFYTGIDAFYLSSSHSGVCRSCVCRRRRLIAGGTWLQYHDHGLCSTFVVMSILVSRLLLKYQTSFTMSPDRRCGVVVGRIVSECLGWGVVGWEMFGLNMVRTCYGGALWALGLVMGPLNLIFMVVTCKRLLKALIHDYREFRTSDRVRLYDHSSSDTTISYLSAQ